jgi:hypothetical protein
LGTILASLSANLFFWRLLMSLSLAPIIAIGTLSGNLPTGSGARTQAGPSIAPGPSPSNVVSLDESNAVTDVLLQPFSTPQVTPNGASPSDFQRALLLAQEQLEQLKA